ncbi:TspO/MBR family protein, partial [Patescibacteria group bacterium]
MNTFWKIAAIVALAATIVINALANILPFNNLTTGEISNSINSFFTPAAYVFTIWTLIYVLLVGFVVFQALPSQQKNAALRRVRPWFVLSCAANGVWMFLWHYEFFAGSVVAMLVLLGSLIMAYQAVLRQKKFSRNEWLLIKAPFSIYLGWITVATVANISTALVVYDWSGWGIAPQNWAIVMICIAAALAVLALFFRRDYLYAAVIVWALIGIGVEFAGYAGIT